MPGTTKSGRPDTGAAAQVLGAVTRRARSVRVARDAYRLALVRAVDELEQAGCRDPFAQVATAAGVSKQAVRELVGRSRANGS